MTTRDVHKFERERAVEPGINPAGVGVFKPHATHAGFRAVQRTDIVRELEVLLGMPEDEHARRQQEPVLAKDDFLESGRFSVSVRDFSRLAEDTIVFYENRAAESNVHTRGVYEFKRRGTFGVRDKPVLQQRNNLIVNEHVRTPREDQDDSSC